MNKNLRNGASGGTTSFADGFASDVSLDGSATAASVGITPPPNSPDPLEGQKWATTTITWSFATSNIANQLTSFFSFITNSAYQLLVEKAAALWSAISGITMTLVPDSATTDIRVGFEALNTQTDTIGNTTYHWINQTISPGVIVGLEDPAQRALSVLPDGDYSYPLGNFFQDIVHEFGHALGLGHNTVDEAAVMNPALTSKNRSIDPNDAAAIESPKLYGGTDSALSKVVITDNGPDDYAVAAGGKVNPFAGLVVTDGAGLHELVTITVTGGGTLSDPTAGTDANFTGGVFTESGDNLIATDYAQTILRRLVYTASNPDTKASFNVEVDNSLQGSATNNNVTVTPAPVATILATFTGTNGASPKGGLIEDGAGNLFGTTAGGGAHSDGTAFEIPKTATGYGTLTTLASFNNSSIGAGPPAGLVSDSAGDLFGTTSGGGANNAGSVFEIAKGATAPTIVASFNFGAASTTTGEGPGAGLIMDSAGDLFGTTLSGGAYRDGAVFEVPKASVGYGPLKLLGSFNFTDGAIPRAGLTTDSAGNLIGTTSQGGAFSDGTVFKLAETGGTPTTLVNFNGTDGSGPLSGLITDSAGDLFGTTYGGGPSGKGAGTVFEIKKTGTTYASTPITLVDFYTSAAGYEPAGGLIMDAAGNLFGTTSMGGTNGAGTVFEVKTANTATGYASTPLVLSAAFNFSGYGGQLLADRTTGNLFVPSGGGVGYGTEVEITNSGFVTTAPTATAAAAATSPVTSTVAAGSTLNVTGTESIANILDNGTVSIASGGSLDVSSAVDPASTGIFQLTGNASLEIASILGAGLKIQFLGSAPTNKLTVDSAVNFGTQVSTASYVGPLLESFAAGDIIDLKGISNTNLNLAYTSATGDLQITGSSGNPLATLAFQNSTLGAGTFHAASDGVGGTLITHS